MKLRIKHELRLIEVGERAGRSVLGFQINGAGSSHGEQFVMLVPCTSEEARAAASQLFQPTAVEFVFDVEDQTR